MSLAVGKRTCGPGAAGAMTECLGDMRLARTGAADDEDILAAPDEAARRKVDDLRLRHQLEVEVLVRSLALEGRATQPLVEMPCVPARCFVREQTHEKLLVRELVFDGLPNKQVELDEPPREQ